MTTNNQIKNKYEVSSIIGRKLDTIDNMLNEARSDTAKQIFKKLDKILGDWNEYTKDLDMQSASIRKSDYLALKKKYNIEE